mgnify:FL=1
MCYSCARTPPALIFPKKVSLNGPSDQDYHIDRMFLDRYDTNVFVFYSIGGKRQRGTKRRLHIWKKYTGITTSTRKYVGV